MGPNVTRLFLHQNAALRTPQEREVIRALRRARLDGRLQAAADRAAALIASVRADPRDPFRGATDEEIAAELLRRSSNEG